MTDRPHNPNDPEFLLSRSFDEELSEDERRVLDEALAGSESLRAERERQVSLDKLLRRFTARKVDVDWDAFAAGVDRANAAEHPDEAADDFDRLLARWGQDDPEVDWERFTAEVMGRIDPVQSATPWHRMVFRIGAPLAAAAAIALAVLIPMKEAPQGRSLVCYSYPTTRAASTTATRVSVVSYGRDSAEAYAPRPNVGAFGFATVGTVEEETTTFHTPPL
jgi:hypothetical protein